MGLQHVVAMFGATVLAPRLMGFDANIAILMSGIGTLLFFVVTRGKVPSYLGSSFAFIAVVLTATGFSGGGANPNLGVALGGIVACGVLYALIGLAVMATGTAWIEQLMPPVVTGTVVAVIGLNLAAIPVKTIAPTAFDTWMQAMTCVVLAIVAVRARGMAQRLPDPGRSPPRHPRLHRADEWIRLGDVGEPRALRGHPVAGHARLRGAHLLGPGNSAHRSGRLCAGSGESRAPEGGGGHDGAGYGPAYPAAPFSAMVSRPCWRVPRAARG
jgi:hypothetical protein